MTEWEPITAGYTQLSSGKSGGYVASFGPIFRNKAEWSICFQVHERHSNPTGMCHGGALSTFADMQILALPQHTGDPTKHTPTISLAMDYLAPATVGQWVIAKVELLRITRTLIFTQAVLRADGQTVVRSNATYRNNDRTGYALG